MKPIFKFKNIEGKTYKVYYKKPTFYIYKNGKKRLSKNVIATCDDPSSKNPSIIIDKNLSNKVEIRAIAEEFLHAFYFSKKEKEIRPMAYALGEFLYKTGWRKTKP